MNKFATLSLLAKLAAGRSILGWTPAAGHNVDDIIAAMWKPKSPVKEELSVLWPLIHEQENAAKELSTLMSTKPNTQMAQEAQSRFEIITRALNNGFLKAGRPDIQAPFTI